MRNIQLIGRVGQDATEKEVNSKFITEFSIACSEKKADNTYDSIWFKVAKFSDKSTALKNFVKKGDLIFVSGTLWQSTFTDKQGNTKIDNTIKNPIIEFLGNKKEETGTQQTTTAPVTEEKPFEESETNNLPF